MKEYLHQAYLRAAQLHVIRVEKLVCEYTYMYIWASETYAV